MRGHDARPPKAAGMSDFDWDTRAYGKPVSRQMINGITMAYFPGQGFPYFYGGDADKASGLYGNRLAVSDPRVASINKTRDLYRPDLVAGAVRGGVSPANNKGSSYRGSVMYAPGYTSAPVEKMSASSRNPFVHLYEDSATGLYRLGDAIYNNPVSGALADDMGKLYDAVHSAPDDWAREQDLADSNRFYADVYGHPVSPGAKPDPVAAAHYRAQASQHQAVADAARYRGIESASSLVPFGRPVLHAVTGHWDPEQDTSDVMGTAALGLATGGLLDGGLYSDLRPSSEDILGDYSGNTERVDTASYAPTRQSGKASVSETSVPSKPTRIVAENPAARQTIDLKKLRNTSVTDLMGMRGSPPNVYKTTAPSTMGASAEAGASSVFGPAASMSGEAVDGWGYGAGSKGWSPKPAQPTLSNIWGRPWNRASEPATSPSVDPDVSGTSMGTSDFSSGSLNDDDALGNADDIYDTTGFNNYDYANDSSVKAPLPVKLGQIANETPLAGARGTGINRAWKLEAALVGKYGRGTRGYTSDEISAIQNGANFADLGLTGHHTNSVKTNSDWAGDPRNIFFLRQGSGNEHMVLGHPGGTTVSQPGGSLVDRQWMLDNLDQAQFGSSPGQLDLDIDSN